MTVGTALFTFYNGFLPRAYPNTAVPDDAILPYITYEVKESFFDDGEVNSTVELWYHSESEAIPNSKAAEIARAIGTGGVILPVDGGSIWLKRGTPWMIAPVDQADNLIKRRQLNVTMEFLQI